MRPYLQLDMSEMRQRLEARAKEGDKKLGQILEEVGALTVAFLRSYTTEKNRAGRPKHPGGWADKTFKLRDSYYYEVQREAGAWLLIIGNTGRHAQLVEATGKFVVRGVTEPGGPVEEALRKAVAQLAPDWVVT